MKHFNVLDKDLDIHQNYLLEASAGTGKTFSIENIVVRLLIEDHPETHAPLKINEILVVTFTRVATRDLIMRIRKNIVSAIDRLSNPLDLESTHYLSRIIDKGQEGILKGQRALEDALFCFDQAQIYTIHGFCSKMLREHVFEGNMSLDTNFTDQLSTQNIQSVIKNVMRSEVCHDKYCSEQIDRLLKSFMGQYEKLEQALMKMSLQDCGIASSPTFSEEYSAFQQCLNEVKSHHHLNGQNIWQDYESLKSSYKKLRSPLDPDASVQFFCECIDRECISKRDFRRLIADGLVIVDALHPDNRKKKPPKQDSSTEIHYPNLVQVLSETLLPILSRARSADVILLRLAHDCKQYLKHYCAHEEKINFNDLLQHMHEAANTSSFKEQVLKKYSVAIIDEFQDTDPLQWNIFKTLFLTNDQSRFLYLVGDPKQAIYSFRQADIYTYLSAAEALGEDHIASLDTNYRSTPPLIDALNSLFSSEITPNLIPLPKLDKTLPYHPVKAGKSDTPPDFDDSLSSVNFCVAHVEAKRSNVFPLERVETDTFFPHIAIEIHKIHTTTAIPLQGIAILVSDRYQAERLSNFLHQQQIEHVLQRSVSLSESPALNAMKEFLVATIEPKDQSAIKTALGGQIIRYTHTELLELSEGTRYEEILESFHILRKELFEKGFSSFYEELLLSSWPCKNQSIIENLLSTSDGLEFYDDFQQIAEILMEYQSKVHPSPDGLICYLDEFEDMALNDESQIKRRRDPQRDAVNIITMHSSKGLEYDVVYMLAALKRNSAPSKIIPLPSEKGRVLTPVLNKDDPHYLAHCRELDAEKMRLLYVGMTRAKYRLYVPVAFVSKSKVDYGCASPIELYLGKIGHDKTLTYEGMYEHIQSLESSTLKGIATKHSDITYLELEKQVLPPTENIEKESIPSLISPVKMTIPGYNLFMQSFSSLTRMHTGNETLQIDQPAPKDFFDEQKTPFTLPAGSETGNLLHFILETLDFQENDIEGHVAKYTRGTKYELWTSAIHEIIHNVINASIDGFSLNAIPIQSTYREMEFTYPISSTTPYVEEVEYLPGYLKGIIDLILKVNDRYYIIDWKSNWLGSCIDEYQLPQVKASVIDHQYYLQASLYEEALKKYLALIDPRPFEQIFGGAYYIYLRGMSSSRQDTGIICINKEF
jgi:exodeoxyribonuclease V beta subunit